MLLIEKIRADQVSAMKEKNNEKKLAISSLIDAAKKIVIDKGGDRVNIPDEIVTQVVLKELKTIKEQIDSCPADREGMSSCFRTVSQKAKCLLPTKWQHGFAMSPDMPPEGIS